MASSTKCLPLVLVLHLSVVLGLLSISANARPCKTLFISTYALTFHRNYPDFIDQNPNPNFLVFKNHLKDPSASSGGERRGERGSLTFFTEIREFYPKPLDDSLRFPFPLGFVDEVPQRSSPSRGLFSSAGFDSLRDRTKDVLSVVVALLFGVGCGALTAATMYLAWSLFSNRFDYRSSFDDDDNDDDDDDDDDVSPKKMGYLKIPADGTPQAKDVV